MEALDAICLMLTQIRHDLQWCFIRHWYSFKWVPSNLSVI